MRLPLVFALVPLAPHESHLPEVKDDDPLFIFVLPLLDVIVIQRRKRERLEG